MALKPHVIGSNDIPCRKATNTIGELNISNSTSKYYTNCEISMDAYRYDTENKVNCKSNVDVSTSEVRSRLQKSHTCGSLFAKCNCGSGGGVAAAAGPSLTITPPPQPAQNEASSSSPRTIPIAADLATAQRRLRKLSPRETTPTYRRRLFQSFSHPDTDFVFTDEHKSTPLKSLSSRNTQAQVNGTRHRSATPTEAHQHHVLDVYGLDSVPGVSQPLPSVAPRSKLKRADEIDLADVPNNTESLERLSPEFGSPRLRKVNDNFDAAQKFFAESGILGPLQGNDLVRKTSKVLQDPHVIEQIRKTSLVLRTMHQSPLKRASTISQYTFATPLNAEADEFYGGLISKTRVDNSNKECELFRSLQREVTTLKNVIATKNDEIVKLCREIHKLKSVLEQTSCLAFGGRADTSTPKVEATVECQRVIPAQTTAATVGKEHEVVAAPRPTSHGRMLKKQGVSAESCEWHTRQLSDDVAIPKHQKDFASKQLIKDAIMDNDFLKHIDATQVRELVDSMWRQHIPKGEFLITEGDVGAHLYVSADGEFEVLQHGQPIGVIGAGKAFGELAILYNCTRTASIRVLSDNAHVWVLDRRIYQKIMMRTGLQRIESSVNFLKSVPLLKNLNEELLMKIADVLEVEFYDAGTYIIRQGATGDTFFIISQGTVKVTQKQMPTQPAAELRELGRGDYFGEQALINEDKRTANIIAQAPGVECLTLDRDSFLHLIGDLCELKEKSYDDENNCRLAKKNAEMSREIFGSKIKQEFSSMSLDDLEFITTLGIGGFGRVELVKSYCRNETNLFALKCLKKQHIVETKQQEHVFSERTIMLACDSPFICRLYRTFRDSKHVYMLLEACMGGEIWTMLRDCGAFEESAAQFIVGCVLQAFDYLHTRGIIYRDLKPENLMLDQRGYVKLVDFGFAKYIGISNKTWTFCGTPEYVAPEIILNKGHDRAVDYWALGVLIHELLNGAPPFTSNDPMKTYNQILKGIEMIAFPKTMSRAAVQLIKKLCRHVPAERLGYQKAGMQDIKKHKWFLGFDWAALECQTLTTPFVRPLAHATDTSYFDKFAADAGEPPDETSGWDEEF